MQLCDKMYKALAVRLANRAIKRSRHLERCPAYSASLHRMESLAGASGRLVAKVWLTSRPDTDGALPSGTARSTASTRLLSVPCSEDATLRNLRRRFLLHHFVELVADAACSCMQVDTRLHPEIFLRDAATQAACAELGFRV